MYLDLVKNGPNPNNLKYIEDCILTYRQSNESRSRDRLEVHTNHALEMDLPGGRSCEMLPQSWDRLERTATIMQNI
jgi:hypothetical protein